MSEILPKFKYSDPLKTEKINGQIYMMAGGSYKHAEIISNIFSILSLYLKGKPCKPFTSELDVHIDEDNTYRPDISIICDFSKKQEDGYHGAPELVIEVLSPSTAKRDRGDKFDCYQAHGVKELWFVNPEYETIEQFNLINGMFNSPLIHFKSGASFRSHVFEDLEMHIDEIFNG